MVEGRRKRMGVFDKRLSWGWYYIPWCNGRRIIDLLIVLNTPK